MQTQSFFLALRAILLTALFLSSVLDSRPGHQPVGAPGPILMIGELVTPKEFVGNLRQLPQAELVDQSQQRVLFQPEQGVPEFSTGASPETPLEVQAMPGPLTNFPGLDKVSAGGGYVNPDTVGDVGPNHYLQAVNLAFGIFDKAGTLLAASTFQNLWAGAGTGTACDSNPRFTPLVLYDPLADRWIVSVVATNNLMNGPYYQCFAVSKTGDPVSGGWWLYAIRADDDAHPYFTDLPKLGLWQDGLYMAANQYDCLDATCLASAYKGVRVWAFNLSRMESGLPAQSVLFDVGPAYYILVPSNLRGELPPPGTPNYFVTNEISSPYGLNVWKFHVDWVTPGNSTFTGPILVTTASYPIPPTTVPQLGGPLLSTNGDGLMMQNQYRNIAGVESLWLTHTAGTASGVSGVRWYQLDVTGGAAPSLLQSQTYQPDSTHRWIPSLAVDKVGNMAIGYSVSSSSIYPGIRYAGRLAGDPPGTLAQGEATLTSGTGAQNTGFSRWGLYGAMSVDPVDGCTFWYTNEYYATTGSAWQTRIGSFRFPSCTSTGAVVGTGTPASCSETALETALAGGVISFDCGASPHTIPFNSAKSIVANTTLDGGGTVTLDGQNATRLFEVSNGAALILHNIVLTNGFSSADGGAIHNGALGADTPGSVTLENSVIRNSQSNLSGGAIVSTGPLTITNSLLENNQALNGGALYPRFAGAQTTITHSTLRGNKATDTTNGWGGAALAWDGAQITIQDSDIYSNTAMSGGGLYVFANSDLTLNGGLLRNNTATGLYGGGIYNDGAVILDNVTVSGNRAGLSGGGLYNAQTMTIQNTTVSGNSSTYGGGAWNDTAANLWAWNSTFDGNMTISDGGGVLNFGAVNLYNVTISHNAAGLTNESGALGGGLFNNSGATMNTRNTLLAANLAYNQGIPGLDDCYGEIWSDHSRFTLIPSGCTVTGPSSFPADPSYIGQLADNGGPTLTVALLPGSDAIDAADPVQGCVNMNSLLLTDQRGAPRIVGARCDVGAYEFGAPLFQLFVPLINR